MIPTRFGPAQRQMFGIHQSPPADPRHEAILLCNPFGQEAIRCHRLFKVLADRLARDGFHTLRFDYFATGDSAGEDGEGDIDCWCENIVAADQELRRMSDNRRVSWFGLRLGASIAALASARGERHPDRLLLWDPVIEGRAYLDELRDAHVAARRDAFGARWAIDKRLQALADQEARSEALGFAISPQLRQQIEQLSAAQVANAGAKSISLLANPRVTGLASLRERLKLSGKPHSISTTDVEINWSSNEAMNSSIVPIEIMQTLLALAKGDR